MRLNCTKTQWLWHCRMRDKQLFCGGIFLIIKYNIYIIIFIYILHNNIYFLYMLFLILFLSLFVRVEFLLNKFFHLISDEIRGRMRMAAIEKIPINSPIQFIFESLNYWNLRLYTYVLYTMLQFCRKELEAPNLQRKKKFLLRIKNFWFLIAQCENHNNHCFSGTWFEPISCDFVARRLIEENEVRQKLFIFYGRQNASI